MEKTATHDDHFARSILVHRNVMLRAATHLTGSSSDAEDLVQEALLKAYRAFSRLRPQSQTRPWLLKILRNTFISQWRRRRREREVIDETARDETATWLLRDATQARAPLVGPGDDWSSRPDDALGDEVVKALSEVPDTYRTLVLLVDVHQKSYQEAAELTRQPLGTVQSRLFRGRRILKGLLQDYARREGYVAQAA
jgi:RNA polymerase sigma-70 factor (ECF subfamily)